MTMIGRLWSSFFSSEGTKSTRRVQPETTGERANTTRSDAADSFSFSVIKSPILAEIEQMAREMAPKQAALPPAMPALKGEALGEYWQSLGETFEAHYGQALNQKLQSRGLQPLSRGEQADIARAYQVASQKLSARVAVTTAAEVMKQHMTAEQVRQLEANTLNEISASQPVGHFEGVPIHLAKMVTVAASGPAGIYLNPIINNIPASPYKTFVLGHERNHVVAKDGVESVAIMLLKTNLQNQPELLSEVERAESEIARDREFAADRAGTDAALKEYPAARVKSELAEMMSVVEEDRSQTHPATEERIQRISAYIEQRTAQTASSAPRTVAFQNVFHSPIFDELAEIAKTI